MFQMILSALKKIFVLENPETIFARSLYWNPVYPFKEIEANVFMLTVKFHKFYVSLAVSIMAVIIFITVSCVQGRVSEYNIFLLMIFCGFFQHSVWSYKKRTYVLDSNTNMYEFYRGDTLIYQGDYHNIYIRLKGIKSGAGSIYYSVVLNGYNIDEESITMSGTSRKKLGKLGKRLALRLGVNYFDADDTSKHHVILHKCPYRFDSKAEGPGINV